MGRTGHWEFPTTMVNEKDTRPSWFHRYSNARGLTATVEQQPRMEAVDLLSFSVGFHAGDNLLRNLKPPLLTPPPPVPRCGITWQANSSDHPSAVTVLPHSLPSLSRAPTCLHPGLTRFSPQPCSLPLRQARCPQHSFPSFPPACLPATLDFPCPKRNSFFSKGTLDTPDFLTCSFSILPIQKWVHLLQLTTKEPFLILFSLLTRFESFTKF